MARWLLLSLLCAVCLADIYMHNPRGSNDRNCEKDVNRQNANRLFDSQNNAKGGYACPYPENNRMYYYSGSKLKVEWTAQHGCGGTRSKCDIVLQYMCTPDSDQFLRDGTPTSPNNNDGTQRIPEDATQYKSVAYGMHENYDYYELGKDTSRNLGLFTADRNLGNGEGGATRTRQNNNGDRHGFEIPEERDYYPYWRSSPWIDVAIYTDDSNGRCAFLKAESENVKPRGRCVRNGAPKYKPGTWPNNPTNCSAMTPPGTWVVDQPRGLPAPDCKQIPYSSRENQLGNVGNTASPMYYDWTIPDVTAAQRCVLRIRYNVSWSEYIMNPPSNQYLDARSNKNSSIQTDPFVTVYGNLLSMKVNTNQIGRTFQDRSYVFKIKPRPDIPSTTAIYNLNVRGKRGNIVQVYPAVEYDFIPNRLTVKQNDIIHVQWVGSDYNPQRGPNDAEGGPPAEDINQNARADRSNLVEVRGNSQGVSDRCVPYTNASQLYASTMFVNPDGTPDVQTIVKLAYLGQGTLPTQGKCLTLAELKDASKRNQERAPNNCAKINTPSPYFDGGLVTLRKLGSFAYMCSRNNNFSNRNQQGTIAVTTNKRSTEQTDPNTPAPPPDFDPVNTIDIENGTSIDNPTVTQNEVEVAARANMTTPNQTNDNDGISDGTKNNQNLTQQAAVFAAMGVDLPTAAGPTTPIPTTSPTSPPDTVAPTSAPTAASDTGLSSGAVAGVAIGCIFGGVLIGAILAFVFYKP